MKSYLCLFLVVFVPLSLWAECFERFYSAKHLKTYKNQSLRNIQLSWDYNYDRKTTKHSNAFQLQIQMKIAGKIRVGHARGFCSKSVSDFSYDAETTLKCQFANGTGEIILKKYGNKKDIVGEIEQIIAEVSGGAKFEDRTLGAAKGTLIQIPLIQKYSSKRDRHGDYRFRLDKNLFLYSNSCEETLFQARTASVTRLWNEMILHAIRNDLARPTVTARNLLHWSALMWDTYAAFDKKRKGYFVQKKTKLPVSSREVAMSYASYTFLKERYKLAPGNTANQLPLGDGEGLDSKPDLLIDSALDRLMLKIGLPTKVAFDEKLKDPASLGIYMARELLKGQKNDGSREVKNYAHDSSIYTLLNGLENLSIDGKSVDAVLDITQTGVRSPRIETWKENGPNDFELIVTGSQEFSKYFDIDHWLPLWVPGAIDQGGNAQDSRQSPLTLFWGALPTFGDLREYKSNKGTGLYFDKKYSLGTQLPKFAKQRGKFIRMNLDVVRISSLLNPENLIKEAKDFDGDGQPDANPGAKLIDISPLSMGANTLGTNNGSGYKINPITKQPYQPNMVKQADFGRSIAEFWADGPSSETPPGHWNTLANYVVDQLTVSGTDLKWKGIGHVHSRQEYELKLYLALNGALHDAAVVAWGIKGHYQGNRPITVFRKFSNMAENDPKFAKELISYLPDHLKMVTYEKEIVDKKTGKTLGKKKLTKLAVKAWRGHSYFGELTIKDLSFRGRDKLASEEENYYEQKNIQGVGWILADNWLPYQKTSFVTPPFPGFVSGHSTFSRAAAEVLAGVTGDIYFPGGLGTYSAPELEFESPSEQSFEFQWATYYDASDQSGISRIYGGIHASYDDLPARKIGSDIGKKAMLRADKFFMK